MRLRCSLLFFLMAAFAAPGATLIVSDSFTDGSRTNTGGNPLELVYYMGQTTSTLFVTNDNAFGTSNSLCLVPAAGAGFGKFLAYFNPVTLTNPGDSITLTFDFRFMAAPTNINAGLRAGLYNNDGVYQTNDATD